MLPVSGRTSREPTCRLQVAGGRRLGIGLCVTIMCITTLVAAADRLVLRRQRLQAVVAGGQLPRLRKCPPRPVRHNVI